MNKEKEIFSMEIYVSKAKLDQMVAAMKVTLTPSEANLADITAENVKVAGVTMLAGAFLKEPGVAAAFFLQVVGAYRQAASTYTLSQTYALYQKWQSEMNSGKFVAMKFRSTGYKLNSDGSRFYLGLPQFIAYNLRSRNL